MALHHKTKEAAVKKYGHLEGETLNKAIGLDPANYTEEETAEILAAIEKSKVKPPDPAASTTNMTLPAAPVSSSSLLGPPGDPNQLIRAQLQTFDYSKLTGESFKKYCLLVQSLGREDKYDFELYHVEVIRRERYRGVKDTPMDTVGFRMKNTTPINRTRIPVKHALEMNGRVESFLDEQGEPLDSGFETIGCQLDHNGVNGRYYLLKK